ncbi:MAG: cysteine--tRNA ligase, partial [Dongiaceae bacterium]
VVTPEDYMGDVIGDLTARTAAAFHEDMARLNALPPTAEPRATEHIPAMIVMIETLIARGFAYVAEGHALFHVPAMTDYGRLSGRSLDDMIAGARVEVAPYKKHPADFVLWKPSAPDQPGWDSPWGRGRPGWHIECSAMAATLLGQTFDIHGGGQDLIFPHHENEIAQSRCAHGGAPLARFWLHNGFVQVEGEKMSKSLGNFFTVRELLEEGHRGEAIRLALLSGHYRQPLDITRDGLREARAQLDRFYLALRGAPAATAAEPPLDVLAALEDDLNTPMALSHLHEAAHALNKATRPADKARLKGDMLTAGALLGLIEQDPEEWLQAPFVGQIAQTLPPIRRRTSSIGQDGGQIAQTPLVLQFPGELIETMISERAAARKARNFAEADRIRDELAKAGIILEDGPTGTTWRRGG